MRDQIPAQQRLSLARAMGYAAYIDDTGGYGVERVILPIHDGTGRNIVSREVFQPEREHFTAVLEWLSRQDDVEIRGGTIWLARRSLGEGYQLTPSGIARAVVMAAVRVAEKK